MIAFIVGRIEEAANKSIDEGQEKYKAYFINTTIYAKYQEAVDTKLIKDGYSEVIPVTE